LRACIVLAHQRARPACSWRNQIDEEFRIVDINFKRRRFNRFLEEKRRADYRRWQMPARRPPLGRAKLRLSIVKFRSSAANHSQCFATQLSASAISRKLLRLKASWIFVRDFRTRPVPRATEVRGEPIEPWHWHGIWRCCNGWQNL
jgi:hypothetical protein